MPLFVIAPGQWLPCPRHCWRRRWAFTPPFHPFRQLPAGGLFSVALIRERRGRRSPEFLWWLALRCPDFPQVLRAAPAVVWFAYQALAHLLPWGKPHDEAQSGQGHLGPRLSFYPPGYPQALLIFSADFIKYPLRYPTASHRFPLSPKYHHG